MDAADTTTVDVSVIVRTCAGVVNGKIESAWGCEYCGELENGIVYVRGWASFSLDDSAIIEVIFFCGTA